MVQKTLLWSAITSVLTTAIYAMDVTVRNDVITLHNQQEFDSTVNSHDLVLMKFFSPTCGHCIAMKSEYQLAATNLLEDKIPVAEVDCTANGPICDKYGVKGYPTIQIFRKGRASDLYPHERTSDSIVKYMRKQTHPPLPLLKSSQELEDMKKKESLVVVAYLDPKSEKKIEEWKLFSDEHMDDFAFAYITDEKLAQESNITQFPTVVLYKPFDNMKDIHEGAFKSSEIIDFIKLYSVPLFDSIKTETFMDYVDAGRPLVYVFSNSEEMKNELHETLLPLTKKYKGKFSFVHIDGNEYPAQAEFLSLKPNQWPALSIHNFKTGARFPLDQSKDIKDVQLVQEFLDKVHQDKASPAIKSQAFVNTSDQDTVRVVVGKDFEDVVMDKSKDVFIEIYAPWCGHCRKLAPTWQQLGEFMKENEADKHNMVIAKMDGTVNDVPPSAGFQVAGYPTIKFFKAKTNSMVDYHGQRTLRDFVKFLNEHSSDPSFKVDLSSLPAEVVNKRSDMPEVIEGFSGLNEKHDEL